MPPEPAVIVPRRPTKPVPVLDGPPEVGARAEKHCSPFGNNVAAARASWPPKATSAASKIGINLVNSFTNAPLGNGMEDERRTTYVPALFIPIAYFWYSVEPAILWLIYRHRAKRVARFLACANNTRMRQERVDRRIALRPPSRGDRASKCDIPGSIDGT